MLTKSGYGKTPEFQTLGAKLENITYIYLYHVNLYEIPFKKAKWIQTLSSGTIVNVLLTVAYLSETTGHAYTAYAASPHMYFHIDSWGIHKNIVRF